MATDTGSGVEEGLRAIRAPVLLVASRNDLVFRPAWVETTRELIAAGRAAVDLVWIDGPDGHYDGLSDPILQVTEPIKTFLAA